MCLHQEMKSLRWDSYVTCTWMVYYNNCFFFVWWMYSCLWWEEAFNIIFHSAPGSILTPQLLIIAATYFEVSARKCTDLFAYFACDCCWRTVKRGVVSSRHFLCRPNFYFHASGKIRLSTMLEPLFKHQGLLSNTWMYYIDIFKNKFYIVNK